MPSALLSNSAAQRCRQLCSCELEDQCFIAVQYSTQDRSPINDQAEASAIFGCNRGLLFRSCWIVWPVSLAFSQIFFKEGPLFASCMAEYMKQGDMYNNTVNSDFPQLS